MTSANATATPLAHVTVSAFDVHLWSKLFDPACFNPKAHFLWSPSEYPAKRAADTKVDLGKLILFPLHQEIAVNHFWTRYKTTLEKLPGGPATPLGDVREFLWPLRCRPKGLDLTFTASKAKLPPKVWATIWLWPFGWSSTIKFKVAAPFSLDDLQDLGMKLRNKSPAPFALNGRELSLSAVFKLLADMVRQEIGVAGKVLPDVGSLTRHVVSAMQLPRGMTVPTSFKNWAAADQLRILGALRGSKVGLSEIVGPGQQKFLATPLGNGNFAVTDFDEGTTLVLRHWKDLGPSVTRETNHCLFENVRNFCAVQYTLHRFTRYAKDQAEIAAAVANAQKALVDLPSEYENRFSAAFTGHYAPRAARSTTDAALSAH